MTHKSRYLVSIENTLRVHPRHISLNLPISPDTYTRQATAMDPSMDSCMVPPKSMNPPWIIDGFIVAPPWIHAWHRHESIGGFIVNPRIVPP